MIAIFALASVGAGSLFFLLIFVLALLRESRLHRSRLQKQRPRSLTLVMLERYRKDRAA